MLIPRLPAQQIFNGYRPDGLSLFFISNAVRQVAMIVLSVFSPLYIFETLKNFDFSSQTALGLTLVYFAILFGVKLVLLPVAENLGFHFGFKKIIFISLPAFFFFLITLLLSKFSLIFLFSSAILWGVHDSIFWWGYHGFFITSGEPHSYGRQIGGMGIGLTVVGVASPVLGGILAQSLGFDALFWAAGVGMIVSMLFLIPAKDHRPRVKVAFFDVWNIILRHKGVAAAYAANAAEASLTITVWPLFLFLILGTTLGVGGVLSAASLVAAALVFLVGTWIDGQGKRAYGMLLAIGAPLIALTWFLRFFARTTPVLVGIDSVYRFVDQLVSLPLNVLTYQKAAEEGIDKALMFYEIAITGGAFLITILLSVTLFLGVSLGFSFVLAGFIAVVPLFAVKQLVGIK